MTPDALPRVAQRTDLRRIGPLVALVLAAHALMLAIPRQAPSASGPVAPVHGAVQFRLVEPAPLAPSLPALAAASADARAEPSAPASLRPEPVAEASAELAEPPPAAAAAVPPAESWLGLALPGVATEDDLYFARALLSVVPAPLQAITIDYPSFAGDAGRYVSELSLFIDETGAVVRVRVDGDPLPPALEEAARGAFLRARFRPGEVADLGIVKSRIRVEVTFDSQGLQRGG